MSDPSRPRAASDPRLTRLGGRRKRWLHLLRPRSSTPRWGEARRSSGRLPKLRAIAVCSQFIQAVLGWAFVMALDLSLVDKPSEPSKFTYAWKDTVLYALGIGAKKDELDFLYEGKGPKV